MKSNNIDGSDPTKRIGVLIMRNFFFSILFLIFSITTVRAAVVQGSTKSVSGKVEFSAPGAKTFQPLKTGQTLPIGSTIKTGADGVAIILTVPGAAVRIGPDSNLTISEMDFEKKGEKVVKRKALLDLKTGTVSALIEHNTPEATDFKIKTPQGIAAARGTFYGVTVTDGKTHVAVQEGKVGIQELKEASQKAK
jgi:hypothetical protein